jgi:hypothetical protein
LANALTVSKLNSISLTYWPNGAELPTFLETLSQGLASSTSISTIKLEDLISRTQYYNYFEHDLLSEIDGAVLRLVESATKCPTLKNIELPIARYTEAMNIALARLVSIKSSELTTLVVLSSMLHLGEPQLTALKLLEALKKNYTTASIDLKAAAHKSVPGVPDDTKNRAEPWDAAHNGMLELLSF